MGATQGVYGGNADAFVAKLSPAGDALLFATYLGGSQGDEGYGIAVDCLGNIYVAGDTASADFPTKNALQATLGDAVDDMFVTKINPMAASLVFSTYLGGSAIDHAWALAVDPWQDIY